MRYLICTDWDEVAQTCLAQAWVEDDPSGWPELSSEQAGTIGGAIIGLMALAYLFRILFRNAERS